MIHRGRAIAAWIGLVCIVAVAFYVMQQRSLASTRANQLDACERGNILRQALKTNAGVQEDFIETARATRQASADTFKAQGNLTQFGINQAAADAYQRQLDRLVAVDLVDCEHAVR